jgi:hypothetical protein
MWEDFQCPFCAKFAQETEPVLVDRFVEDGVLRLDWRGFRSDDDTIHTLDRQESR